MPKTQSSEFTDPHEILKAAFPGIRRSIAEELLSEATLLDFPSDTVICHEGAVEDTFYIILKGRVQVTKVINEREVRVLNHLESGGFFGEMAIIHNAPRAATVATTEPTQLLQIRKDTFSQLMERSTSMSLAMVRVVSNRLRDNDTMAIEDLREKAGELADAYQQLAETEQARSEFLTTIAHELRTPLMAANGFMQVIRAGRLQGETLVSAMETVSRNIEDIVALTNDILFLQELDLILPEFNATDLGAVVAAAVENQRPHAERNSVGLKLDLAPNLPSILGDPQSLERAIRAIIDNAIKFSPDGGDVVIRVDHTSSQIVISILDHGVGIPAEAQPRIFDRFFHIDCIGDHLFRGVGLGLSVARQVIEQHKGNIRVRSALNQGSEFLIFLPIPRITPHFTGSLKK